MLVVQVDPSHYRELDELAKSVTGRLEILQQVVVSQQGDVDLEQEISFHAPTADHHKEVVAALETHATRSHAATANAIAEYDGHTNSANVGYMED